MSNLTAEDLSNIPLIDAADIQWRVRDLIGRAITRKIWLLLLDAERRQLPVFLPIDGLPTHAPPGESMGPFLRAVCQEPTREVVCVLERPGGYGLTPADRGWLQLFASGVTEAGLGLAGMVLSQTHGTRWLPAEEWGS
ncbi:hypothetical protein [Naasia aerilata]|nr:hypothetical protein [Naasia aerilata]